MTSARTTTTHVMVPWSSVPRSCSMPWRRSTQGHGEPKTRLALGLSRSTCATSYGPSILRHHWLRMHLCRACPSAKTRTAGPDPTIEMKNSAGLQQMMLSQASRSSSGNKVLRWLSKRTHSISSRHPSHSTQLLVRVTFEECNTATSPHHRNVRFGCVVPARLLQQLVFGGWLCRLRWSPWRTCNL